MPGTFILISAFTKQYNHSNMRKYDLVLEEYWVTHSGNFRLMNNKALFVGITYVNILFYHGISDQIRDNTFSISE